jgi:arylsulfatase A-like enzyme
LEIVAPGRAKPGAQCDQGVNLMSLYPTPVALCSLSPADAARGALARPLLEDPDAEWPHAALTTYRRGNHAVKWGRRRCIRRQDGSAELYDLAVDPHEWTNRADAPSTAAVKEKLREFLPTRDAPETRRAPGRKEDG